MLWFSWWTLGSIATTFRTRTATVFGRRRTQLVHGELPVLVLVERQQRSRGILDFGCIDDAVVICIERLDQRRRWWPSFAAAAGPRRAWSLAGFIVLCWECKR